MKKTTFRKRALLSSVAMMLVALVALGSATFAWFTANNTVTATGLSVQASTADGLKIYKTTVGGTAPSAGDYVQTVTITEKNNETWVPVTPVVGASGAVAFYTTSAASYDNYASSTAATSNTTAFYSCDLYLKATGTVNSLSVSAAIDGTGADYARVLLVDADSHAVYLSNDAVAATTYKIDGDTKLATATTYSSAGSGNLDITGGISAGKMFHCYIYFEGQDPECKDANAGGTLTVNLTFTKA